MHDFTKPERDRADRLHDKLKSQALKDGLAKPKRYENALYKEFIKQQPCCVTGKMMVNMDTGKTESDPHHTRSRGAGGSDLTMIPLLHSLHAECENIGGETFQKKYNVNFEHIIMKLLMKWIEENMGEK